MKKRILTVVFIVLCMLSAVVLSSCDLDFLKKSCDHEGYHAEPVIENRVDPEGENPGTYDEVVYCTNCGEEVSRTQKTFDDEIGGNTNIAISVEGLAVNGTGISGTLSNAVSELDLTAIVTSPEGTDWFVSSDEAGEAVLDKANITLSTGANTFYLHVTKDEAKTVYTLEIYRKNVFTVTFDAGVGETADGEKTVTVSVEEGAVVSPVEAVYEYHVLGGWMIADENGEMTSAAFDFEAPITENVSLIAKWEVDPFEAKYTVRYNFQNVSLSGYSVDTDKTYEGMGVWGTLAEVSTPEYEDYVLRSVSENKTILPDGSLVIDVYYDVDLDSVLVKSDKFTIEGTTIKGSFQNSTTKINLLNYLSFMEGAEWRITTKSGTALNYMSLGLSAGNNQFYIHVTKPEAAVRTYTLEIYRNRMYSVSFSAVGDAVPSAFKSYTTNVEEGNTARQPSSTTYQGYVFKGWEKVVTTESGTTYVPFDFSTPITENTEIVGRWEEDTNIKYVVYYHFQDVKKDTYVANEDMTVIGGGRANEYVECPVPEVYGFTLKSAPEGGNIKIDGSLVMRVYYDRNVYTVTTVSEDTAMGTVSAGGSYRYGTVIRLNAYLVAGHKFEGWYSNDTLVSTKANYDHEVTKDVTLTGKWKVRDDIPYKVVYYMQRLSGSGYDIGESYTFYGTLNEKVEAEIKTFEGFHRREDTLSTSDTIKGDGKTEIRLYYNRNSYSVQEGYASAKSYLYGTTLTFKTTVANGYVFDGWYKNGELVSTELTYTFVVTENAQYLAKKTPLSGIKYTVEHYLQIASGTWDNFKTAYPTSATYTKEYTGYTGQIINISENLDEYVDTIEGYYYSSSTSGSVAYDGSLVLKVYYNLEKPYIEAKNDKAEAGTVTEIKKNIPYGMEVKFSAAANKGYAFAGWYSGEELVSTDPSYTFEASKQLKVTAKWECTETEYSVTYYKQTSLSGVTGPGVTVTYTATTEQTVTAPAYAPYVAEGLSVLEVASTVSGVVKGDGSLALKVYYVNPICCSYKDSDGVLNIFFGEYPQSIKADDVTITDITDDRGYYLGSDGAYYAKVVANPYKDDTYKFTNGEKIMTGETYYFKVEPIRWRLFQTYLDSTTYYDSIICDVVLDAQMFNSSGACQYPDSDIRNWLNGEFYDIAFDSSIRGKMKATYVYNTLDTMYPFYKPTVPGATLNSEYVFLPSYSELVNTKSGFMAGSEYDPARQRIATDYARARGILVNEYGYARWYQRTPGSYNKNNQLDYIIAVGQNGEATSTAFPNKYEGVVPVITIYRWAD